MAKQSLNKAQQKTTTGSPVKGKSSNSIKQEEINSQRESVEKFDESRHVCCCEFRILAYASNFATLTPVGDRANKTLTVKADTAATSSAIGATAGQPPATSNDTDNEIQSDSTVEIQPEKLARVRGLTIETSCVNARSVVILEIRVSGVINAYMPCAPSTSKVTFSVSDVVDQGNITQDTVTVQVIGRTACGEKDECNLSIII